MIHRTLSTQGLASSSGLSVSEKPFSTMYPSSLFSKPLFATQDYIHSISMYSLRGMLLAGLSICLSICCAALLLLL